MDKTIRHANIIYVRDLSELGGVETFAYEMVKKYHDLDIAVVYKTAHYKQLNRIKEYCLAYKHTDQPIICDVAIINYDTSIIDYINEDIYKENLKPNDKRGIYQTVHGDYENPAYKWKPPVDDRIKEYLGVTKHIRDSFKRLMGLDNVTYCYNPLTITKEKKLVLLSATRLSPIKGKDRMIKLARALDQAGIRYIWYVFTNDTDAIDSPNVVYMKPRLDISYWMDQADYIVQLSDTEACSYTINEGLYRNKPIIVTPLPYLEEIGVKDNINAYIMNFDCSNIDEIVKKILKVPSFIFNKLKDGYGDLLAESKSHYEEDRNMKYLVEATKVFKELECTDSELGKIPEEGERWEVSRERLERLLGDNEYKKVFVKLIEEEKKENKEDSKPNELNNKNNNNNNKHFKKKK